MEGKMIGSKVRPTLLAVVLLMVGFLAAGAAGCDHGHSSRRHVPVDVAFEVDNHHGHTIYVEGIDDQGHVVFLGHVYEHEEVEFILSDYWVGRTLHAHCDYDDDELDREFVYDGLHW